MKRPKPVLLYGEDEIGTLEITGNDMPWVYGSFAPLPSFEKFSPLFRLLQEALEGNTDSAGEDGDLHLQLLEHVNQLGLAIKHPNGQIENIRDFKIEDDQFEYKAVPNPPEEIT